MFYSPLVRLKIAMRHLITNLRGVYLDARVKVEDVLLSGRILKNRSAFLINQVVIEN